MHGKQITARTRHVMAHKRNETHRMLLGQLVNSERHFFVPTEKSDQGLNNTCIYLSPLIIIIIINLYFIIYIINTLF
jgi:hypothetical protein